MIIMAKEVKKGDLVSMSWEPRWREVTEVRRSKTLGYVKFKLKGDTAWKAVTLNHGLRRKD